MSAETGETEEGNSVYFRVHGRGNLKKNGNRKNTVYK